jgi:hypothetical protein
MVVIKKPNYKNSSINNNKQSLNFTAKFSALLVVVLVSGLISLAAFAPVSALVDTSGMDGVFLDTFDNEANWNINGGWNLITNGSTPNDWGTGNIAYINSVNGKYNKPQTLMTIGNIDLTGYKTVLLQFNTDVSYIRPGNQRAYVIVTNETGYRSYVWFNGKKSYDGIVQIDISKLVAGNKSISLTFQYQCNKKNSNCWWEVDDVKIFGDKSSVTPYSKVHIDPTSKTTNENAGSVTLDVIRDGDTTGAVSVGFMTDNNTAQPGVNYGTNSDEYTGTVSFAPGETSQLITIPILSDGVITPDLSFNVTLTGPTTGNVAFEDPIMANVTIHETDSYSTPAVLQFSKAAYSVAEDGVGSVTLSVTRTVNTTGTVTVSYITANGTAYSGVNFGTAGDGSDVTNTLTFYSGDTTKEISIPILEDGIYTPDLSFTVELNGNSANSNLVAPSTATVTINNADPYVLNLKQGWNLISFPVVNNTIDASDLEGIGATDVARYNQLTSTYDVYMIGISLPEYDFKLQTDYGYWVYCESATSLIVYGQSPVSRSVTLSPGWNLVGWSTLVVSNAKTVSGMLSDDQDIARYNTTTHTFDVYMEGISTDDYSFNMHPGEGYFIGTPTTQTFYYGGI